MACAIVQSMRIVRLAAPGPSSASGRVPERAGPKPARGLPNVSTGGTRDARGPFVRSTMTSSAHRTFGPAVALTVLSIACAGPTPSPAAAPARSTERPGYEIVMQATACWTGGLWGDAIGETGSERIDGIAQRCHELLRSIGGAGDDYYPLRAGEGRIVDAIAHRVQTVAERSAEEFDHAHDLVVFLRAIAAATRETIDARRAADVVKDDEADQPQAFVRRADKAAAAPKLQASDALHALLQADVGPFAAEAHAVGLLSALDRMEIARGLPKHLKIYAVRAALSDVFHVPAPNISGDAPAPIPSGTWLAYLSDVAQAAGHPVPAEARDPQNREPLAWTGVLEGFADRLRAASLPERTPLADVAALVIARLDDEYRNERVVYEAHAPAFR